MRYTYCPACGTKLVLRPIGDEGPTPFCPSCARPWFDAFASCVLVLVHNRRGEIALLREDRLSREYLNLVSGYIKPGERAEDAARREVFEELGLTVTDATILGTWWFPAEELLMIGCSAGTLDVDFRLSGEVDGAAWVPAAEALALVPPRGPENATHYVVEAFLESFRL